MMRHGPLFWGRQWELRLSAVYGKLSKIHVSIFLSNRHDAGMVAMESFLYCRERLGAPSEQTKQKAGLFTVWDTRDGNVVLQASEGQGQFLIAIILTSAAARKFELR